MSAQVGPGVPARLAHPRHDRPAVGRVSPFAAGWAHSATQCRPLRPSEPQTEGDR